MHYTLAQCKELAEKLLLPMPTHTFLEANLHHAMPWPSDEQIKAVLLEEAKSKKRAALRLGITRRCLCRRLKEIKVIGCSDRRMSNYVDVKSVLIRLTNNQTFQQISEETEIHQAWLCRLVSGLMVAFHQKYHAPDLRPRNPARVRAAEQRQAERDVRAARNAVVRFTNNSGSSTPISLQGLMTTRVQISSVLSQLENSTNNIWTITNTPSASGWVSTSDYSSIINFTDSEGDVT